jgi:hypothetical protein
LPSRGWQSLPPSHALSASWKFGKPYRQARQQSRISKAEMEDLHPSTSSFTVTGTWQRFLTLGAIPVSSEQFRK